MQHIPFPHTKTDVVNETIVLSRRVSEECDSTFAVITYDLAIAKIVKKIQNEEPDEFKDVLIMFGAFHIEGSISAAIGKLIEGSGGPYLLIEFSVIVPGSMNRFLRGKMYNRCRRWHTILSTALHGLNFQSFLMDAPTDIDFSDELKVWLETKWYQLPLSLMELSNQYQKYVDDTFAGKRRETAQFWMTYCRIIDYFLLIHRSIKTNDIDLFKYALFEICGIFFVVNQPSYARWMTYYALKLENIQNEKPEVIEHLENAAVSRSGKSFTRVTVDMALEQTSNAEAKNRLKGILAFADINSVVNRWQVIISMKTQIIKSLLEMKEIKNYNAETKELNHPRIERDHQDLQALTNIINSTINSFLSTVTKILCLT